MQKWEQEGVGMVELDLKKLNQDIATLRKLKEELEAEIAAEGDTSLLDNTYVAFFDGR